MTVFNKFSCKSRHKTQKTLLQTIISIIFSDFLPFYQMLLSSQVTRCAIIADKYGIYELPQNLPNDLKVRIEEIRNYQETVLISQKNRLVPSLLGKMKISSMVSKSSCKIEINLSLQCTISQENQKKSQIICE